MVFCCCWWFPPPLQSPDSDHCIYPAAILMITLAARLDYSVKRVVTGVFVSITPKSIHSDRTYIATCGCVYIVISVGSGSGSHFFCSVRLLVSMKTFKGVNVIIFINIPKHLHRHQIQCPISFKGGYAHFNMYIFHF